MAIILFNLSKIITLQVSFSFDFSSLWPIYSFGPLIALILYMITHPDKIERWHEIFARLFSFISKTAERHSVSADIQARLYSFIAHYPIKEIFPYKLRIKWVTNSNFESYVEENEVIVIMDNHSNNARNFVNAITAYTSQGLFPSVREYLPSDILGAAELLIQEKIIREKRPDALQIFKKEIIPSMLEINPEINPYKDKFSILDTYGYFDNLFLVELSFSGPRLEEHDMTARKKDIDGFIFHLKYLAGRQPGDDSTPLFYDGKVFRPWTILVAKPETIVWGSDPYTKRVNQAITRKYDSVYLMARKNNMKYIEPLVKAIKENTKAKFISKKIFRSKTYDGKKVDAIVCLFRL